MFDCLAMEVVDAQVVAWRARDAAAFAEFYAPDAVIVMGPGEGDTLEGRDAIWAHYENALLEMPADTKLEIANRITSGEYVIDEEALWGDGFAGEAVAIYRVQSVPILVQSQDFEFEDHYTRRCLITHVQFLPWVDHEEGVAE